MRQHIHYNTSVTRTIRTTCTMDCPDSCALEVSVADGKITRIQAAPAEQSAHPNTQGFICDKVGKFDRRVYHESRILHPQRRVGPKGVVTQHSGCSADGATKLGGDVGSERRREFVRQLCSTALCVSRHRQTRQSIPRTIGPYYIRPTELVPVERQAFRMPR